jgi:hypothetical protein
MACTLDPPYCDLQREPISHCDLGIHTPIVLESGWFPSCAETSFCFLCAPVSAPIRPLGTPHLSMPSLTCKGTKYANFATGTSLRESKRAG